MLKKTSADRIPSNEVDLLSCLFQYRKGRQYVKTPVKCTLEMSFSVFTCLVSSSAHLEICCLLLFTHPTSQSFCYIFYGGKVPVKLFCSPYCCWLSGLTVLNFKSLVLVMANFCLPALRVRGLALPEMARLKPQKPR